MSGRTIAIGDIHGCATALAALLEAIAPRPEDVIVTLGDYVDRGPDSRGVIEQLIDLSKRCTLVPILGNHEEMLLRALANPTSGALQRWLSAGGNTTLSSYGFDEGASDLPPEHLAFLESCVPWYETETHLFFHANYDENTPPDQLSVKQLRWDSLRERMPMRHISGKTAIVGHTAHKNGEIFDRGYLKCLDTYCYGGGWLTALDVHQGRFWQANLAGQLRDCSMPR